MGRRKECAGSTFHIWSCGNPDFWNLHISEGQKFDWEILKKNASVCSENCVLKGNKFPEICRFVLK